MAEESLALIGNASGRVVAGDRSALLLPRLAGSWWIVANVANVPTRQLLLRQHIPCPGSQLIHLNQFEPILMYNGRNRVSH